MTLNKTDRIVITLGKQIVHGKYVPGSPLPAEAELCEGFATSRNIIREVFRSLIGFAPIFPDICYHLTHYKPAAADIPVASDNPAHYADAIRYNARTPLQGSLLPLTRLVWA